MIVKILQQFAAIYFSPAPGAVCKGLPLLQFRKYILLACVISSGSGIRQKDTIENVARCSHFNMQLIIFYYHYFMLWMHHISSCPIYTYSSPYIFRRHFPHLHTGTARPLANSF